MKRWAGGCLLILFAASSQADAQKVVDLSRPVSESLKPDGIYWTFDGGVMDSEVTGVVEDMSGNGYDGRAFAGDVHPAPAYVEGKFGTALYFKGETPGMVDGDGKTRTLRNPRLRWRLVDTPGAWDIERLDMSGKSFSGGVWIRFDQIKTGESQSVVVFQRGMPPDASRWSFVLLKDARDQWKLGMGGAFSSVTSLPNDTNWHHVGFSFKKADEGNVVTFWIDGQPLGAPVATEATVAEVQNSVQARRLTFGESAVGNFSTGFIGAMDDAFVTSGELKFQLSTTNSQTPKS